MPCLVADAIDYYFQDKQICPVGILHCAQGYVILDIVGVCSKESVIMKVVTDHQDLVVQ